MKYILSFFKIIFAGVIAVAILCGIFAMYYTVPVHISNPNENTDYIWPANSVWCQMTEGISWGKYDAKGYNNRKVMENPDVVILGSSHMEATNVLQTENVGHLLSEKLDGEYSVYNMGISGHTLIKICKYLPATLALYEEEPSFIVMETSTTNLQKDSVDALLEGTVDFTPSHDSGLIATLQKFPFFRVTYKQIKDGLLDLLLPEKTTQTKPTQTKPAQVASTGNKTNNEEVYDAFFTYIDDVMKDSSTQLIIVYHPSAVLQEDGSVIFIPDEGNALFSEKCQEHGIAFVDMTEPFAELFASDYKLPHGFITGAIGSGHLNADGHAAMAQELAECITELRQGD